MPNPTSFFFVGSDRQAMPMAALLVHADALAPAPGERPAAVGGDAEPPVPVSPDGQLVPGTLYPSSADPQVRFYLPQYAWSVVDGRYTTSLKWRSSTDDPNGPLAFLTLELAAPAPAAQGFTLQEIPHQAVVRIAFDLPVGGDAATGATLWIEAGALEMAGTVRRCRLPLATKPEFDRLYQVMTEPAFNARLEIRCAATVGTRTWRRIWLDVADLPLRAAATAASPSSPAAAVKGFHLAAESAAPKAAALAAKLSPAIMKTASVQAAPGVFAARPFRDVVAGSDLRISVAGAERNAVPLRAPIDVMGRPVLLRGPVEAALPLAPFCFPVGTNAYMFDVPGDLLPTSHHILIPCEVRGDGGAVVAVYYQDSAFPAQLYYRPQEFRLPRVDTPPYLPDLRVVFSEVAVAAADGAADPEIHYQVHLVYRAVPYIDPGILDLVQQQAGTQVRLTALLPESSRLTLQVPEDETGGALAAVPRDGAEVSFDRGVVDTLELSQSEFERVFAFFQAPSGPGLSGEVVASLLGGLPATIPVELSLRQHAGEVFDSTYKGPIDGGLHRVTVRNRIESPVVIERLYRVALGAGLVAYPQNDPGAVVAPGATLDLDYRVLAPAPSAPPPTAAAPPPPSDAGTAPPPVLTDLPPLLATSIAADPATLWPRLFVNQGYTEDRFTVQVAIDAGFFGAALSGVRVEFDSGDAVTLTAAAPQAAVALRIPLLARLMADPQAERYSYRVADLAGDVAGEPTAWTAMVGDAPLAVVPAGAAA